MFSALTMATSTASRAAQPRQVRLDRVAAGPADDIAAEKEVHERLLFSVIARSREATKQSRAEESPAERDCFAALAMTALTDAKWSRLAVGLEFPRGPPEQVGAI